MVVKTSFTTGLPATAHHDKAGFSGRRSSLRPSSAAARPPTSSIRFVLESSIGNFGTVFRDETGGHGPSDREEEHIHEILTLRYMERLDCFARHKTLYEEFIKLCGNPDKGGMHAIWTVNIME